MPTTIYVLHLDKKTMYLYPSFRIPFGMPAQASFTLFIKGLAHIFVVTRPYKVLEVYYDNYSKRVAVVAPAALYAPKYYVYGNNLNFYAANDDKYQAAIIYCRQFQVYIQVASSQLYATQSTCKTYSNMLYNTNDILYLYFNGDGSGVYTLFRNVLSYLHITMIAFPQSVSTPSTPLYLPDHLNGFALLDDENVILFGPKISILLNYYNGNQNYLIFPLADVSCVYYKDYQLLVADHSQRLFRITFSAQFTDIQCSLLCNTQSVVRTITQLGPRHYLLSSYTGDSTILDMDGFMTVYTLSGLGSIHCLTYLADYLLFAAGCESRCRVCLLSQVTQLWPRVIYYFECDSEIMYVYRETYLLRQDQDYYLVYYAGERLVISDKLSFSKFGVFSTVCILGDGFLVIFDDKDYQVVQVIEGHFVYYRLVRFDVLSSPTACIYAYGWNRGALAVVAAGLLMVYRYDGCALSLYHYVELRRLGGSYVAYVRPSACGKRVVLQFSRSPRVWCYNLGSVEPEGASMELSGAAAQYPAPLAWAVFLGNGVVVLDRFGYLYHWDGVGETVVRQLELDWRLPVAAAELDERALLVYGYLVTTSPPGLSRLRLGHSDGAVISAVAEPGGVLLCINDKYYLLCVDAAALRRSGHTLRAVSRQSLVNSLHTVDDHIFAASNYICPPDGTVEATTELYEVDMASKELACTEAVRYRLVEPYNGFMVLSAADLHTITTYKLPSDQVVTKILAVPIKDHLIVLVLAIDQYESSYLYVYEYDCGYNAFSMLQYLYYQQVAFDMRIQDDILYLALGNTVKIYLIMEGFAGGPGETLLRELNQCCYNYLIIQIEVYDGRVMVLDMIKGLVYFGYDRKKNHISPPRYFGIQYPACFCVEGSTVLVATGDSKLYVLVEQEPYLIVQDEVYLGETINNIVCRGGGVFIASTVTGRLMLFKLYSDAGRYADRIRVLRRLDAVDYAENEQRVVDLADLKVVCDNSNYFMIDYDELLRMEALIRSFE